MPFDRKEYDRNRRANMTQEQRALAYARTAAWAKQQRQEEKEYRARVNAMYRVEE